MEKMKKFVVFPIGLFAVHLLFELIRNPWRYLRVFSMNFWQGLGFFTLNLFGSAAFIFSIALLFTFVFTKINVTELMKKPALKAMGIVFFAELMIKCLLDTIVMPLINRQELSEIQQGTWQGNGWHAVILVLSSWIVGFAVIYFTLRLLMKELKLPFQFLKGWFLMVLFVSAAISALTSYGSLQFVNYLNQTDSVTLETMRIFNSTVNVNVLNNVWNTVSALITTLQDALIYLFFNRCTKQSQVEFASGE